MTDDEVGKALSKLLIAEVAIPSHRHKVDICISCLAVVPAIGAGQSNLYPARIDDAR